jgi:hypothetical protein
MRVVGSESEAVATRGPGRVVLGSTPQRATNKENSFAAGRATNKENSFAAGRATNKENSFVTGRATNKENSFEQYEVTGTQPSGVMVSKTLIDSRDYRTYTFRR